MPLMIDYRARPRPLHMAPCTCQRAWYRLDFARMIVNSSVNMIAYHSGHYRVAKI